MMFVYECPSLQDGARELKEGAARDGEVEGVIVLLDQSTNVDGTDEVRYSALGTDSCTNHSLCAEVVTRVPGFVLVISGAQDNDHSTKVWGWGLGGSWVWGGRVGVGGLG